MTRRIFLRAGVRWKEFTDRLGLAPQVYLYHSRSTGQDFPADFPSTVKAIYRQMLHIFAHLYHAHFTAFLHTSSEAHFNSFFAHFVAFGNEFGLLVCKTLTPSTSLSNAVLFSRIIRIWSRKMAHSWGLANSLKLGKR
jgi:hypothetical protein